MNSNLPMGLTQLEINGGLVQPALDDHGYRFRLPPTSEGYANAQIDDYGESQPGFAWQPETRLSLSARFSEESSELEGTAGFGFWNAPFGPATRRLPSLPQACWFFFASEPSDLPVAPSPVPGRGWMASTVDAGTGRALRWAPLAPLVLALNRSRVIRRWLWPTVQRDLGMSFATISVNMTEWHDYELLWRKSGCFFRVDGVLALATPMSPRGPLGFVCWLDNQYLSLSPMGSFGWGTIVTDREQSLQISNLKLQQLN